MITINRVSAHQMAVNACDNRVQEFILSALRSIKDSALLGNFNTAKVIPSFLDEKQIQKSNEALKDRGFETAIIKDTLYIWWD